MLAAYVAVCKTDLHKLLKLNALSSGACTIGGLGVFSFGGTRMNNRKLLLTLYGHLYEKADFASDKCVYCGGDFDQTDHCPPLAWAGSIDKEKFKKPEVSFYCCRPVVIAIPPFQVGGCFISRKEYFFFIAITVGNLISKKVFGKNRTSMNSAGDYGTRSS